MRIRERGSARAVAPQDRSRSRLKFSQMDDGIKRRAFPWIGLCCILAVYVVSVIRINPQDLFGIKQDDSLYFSSARALANQNGYILPSVPGGLIATKYPVLYPWILSWVWRWNPSFPSNLRDAVGITVAFGVIFLVCVFVFLRRLEGIEDFAALLLTFFVALHPVVLFYSASVQSDMPFAALALAAMLAADRAMQPKAGGARAVGCALLTGFSILLRLFGVPIAAGILAAAVVRRAWQQAAIFCGVLLPFGGAVVWRGMFAQPVVPLRASGGMAAAGFTQAWTYYTSYQGFWRLSVPNAHILWLMVRDNALFLFRAPSDYFLTPLLTGNTIAGTALTLLVTAGIFAGLVRQSHGRGRESIHWAFPFYAALILVWNYPDTDRFLFLFLPLFAAGLWFEARHFLTFTYGTFTRSKMQGEKIIAGILALGVVAVLCGMVLNYARGARTILAQMVSDRASLLAEKREAYQWLSCCTSPEDVAMAYEDASLYLYSGRQSMRPAVFPTSGKYELTYIQDSLDHITDVAHVLGARYWLIADDDFGMEWEPATSLGRAREAELEKTLPLVFQSHNKRIRVYRIGCDDRSNTQPCP
jgi:hypothetical protein